MHCCPARFSSERGQNREKDRDATRNERECKAPGSPSRRTRFYEEIERIEGPAQKACHESSALLSIE
jgi:hypothetical protein